MWSDQRIRRAGLAAMLGGLLALAVTPLQVLVKYATGWAIIPEPAWVGLARSALLPLVSFATPVQLWIVYGALYTLSLALMASGLLALRARVAAPAAWRLALAALVAALFAVAIGDALHTASWHWGGEQLPRANLNPVASAGISVEYLGLPLLFAASLALGIASLRGARLPRLLALLLVAVAPGGVALTVTLLPAMPGGPLAVFAVAMIGLGAFLRSAPRAPLPAPALQDR